MIRGGAVNKCFFGVLGGFLPQNPQKALINSLKLILLFRLVLEEGGLNQKKRNMWTTSFSCSNRRHQHCNGRCSHLGWPVSFIPNQRLPYKLVDRGGPICHSWLKAVGENLPKPQKSTYYVSRYLTTRATPGSSLVKHICT